MSEKRLESEMTRRSLKRRHFLGAAGAALAGMSLQGKGRLFAVPVSQAASAPLSRIKEYRVLGRTGFKVSDVGLGGGEATDPALLEAVLGTGINYIDAAENYYNGQVERAIGQAIKNLDRKSLFISTKLYVPKDATKASLMARARKCLERLRTEYVDCLMMHCPPSSAMLKTPGFHEMVAELKAEGRVRFSGLSQHGAQWNDVSETMEQVLGAAAEDGRFDVALFVYNFIQTGMGERVLKLYAEKKIGTTIMKGNPVGTLAFIEKELAKAAEAGQKLDSAATALLDRVRKVADQAKSVMGERNLKEAKDIREAAYRFVLSNPRVNTVCCTIGTYEALETYVALSGTKLSPGQAGLLDAYAENFGSFYCRHACGECESACPRRVPVNTVMRFQHYYGAQGREDHARAEYAGLAAAKADQCADCSGPCEAACPHGVPVRGLLALTHQVLTRP
jgi:predicted aldo/keto reductase-like oxidoreductase